MKPGEFTEPINFVMIQTIVFNNFISIIITSNAS
ncbi:MAG: hypothetical protein QG599_1509 [Pseudomonadota bacterium]|nr:hypothetical protein [Pseudomonadota bacterium]